MNCLINPTKLCRGILVNVRVKILLLGDGAVGKTAIRERYLGKGFEGKYLMTIGADFAVKDMLLEEHNFNFSIWDLAGQPRFSSVRSMYYKGAHVALIIYDITNYSSFENIEGWIEEMQKNVEINKMLILLLGNKMDLRDVAPESITKEDGLTLSKKLTDKLNFRDGLEIMHFETSAKTGENINEAFESIGRALMKIHNF